MAPSFGRRCTAFSIIVARLRQVLAHVGPGIAEVVQDEGLVRGERQRVLEVRLRLGPLARPLVADAAIVEDQPVGRRQASSIRAMARS